MTLRGGDAVDVYDCPPPYDARLDEPTVAYLEQYADGIPHLDAESWLFYLPQLLHYAIIHLRDPGSAVVEALLWSLRPPDREPPRLGALSPGQEAIIVSVLELLAFSEASAHNDFALQILEEYWIPGALYRKP